MTRPLTPIGLAALATVGLAARSATGTSGTETLLNGAPQAPNAGGQHCAPRAVAGCLRVGDAAGTCR